MTSLPPIAVFDLDGTLVDTAADLVASINAALATHGHPVADLAALAPYAGHGGRGMLMRHSQLQGITFSDDETGALIDTFLAHYEAAIPGVSRIYAGVEAVIADLRADGFKIAICTNKPHRLADKLMTGLGLAAHFDALCGADSFAFRKPDPRHLFETIAAAGGDPARAVMVGDSQTDIDTARNAGIPVAAVDFGYSPVHVSTLNPDAILSAYDDKAASVLRRLALGGA